MTDRYQNLQAGHATPGRHGAVLFDTEVIRVQCFRCNMKLGGCLGGNYQVFIPKLIKEHDPGGMEWWEAKLAASRLIRKWSRDELEELIRRYS